MIKKQNKATIYLTASLLIAIVFFILLFNQFLTNDHAPAEEKQLVTTEPKTAAPKEEKEPVSQTEKESEEETETDQNQDGYVADWFKQSEPPVNEENPEAAVDDPATIESKEKPAEKQNFEEKPLEDPSLPVIEKPEQPSVSSGN